MGIKFEVSVVLFTLLGAIPAVYAQTDQRIEFAANKFGKGLSGLKDSADQLSAGNRALTAQNNALKLRLNQALLKLQQSIEENKSLTRASLKLQDGHPVRAKQIAQLEREAFEADAKMDRLAQEIKVDKDAIERAQADEQQLTKRLSEFGVNQAPTAPPVPDHQKEKLRLLKMVYESKQRQEDVHRQIWEVQKHAPLAAVAVDTSGRKAILSGQIKELQAEIEQLNKAARQVPPTQSAWEQDQMRQLEIQVKDLQKNSDELENLVGRMQQKTQKIALVPDEQAQQNKLRSSLSDLQRESEQMKKELGGLREQMVELDKRKTYLDSVLGR